MEPKIDKEKIKKILIIQFRFIGDLVMSTPLIKILRDEFPDSHIAFLVERGPGEVFEDNPHLDEVIYYDKKKDDVLGSYRFFRTLKEKKFDLAIDLVGTNGTAAAAYLSKAPYRVGYNVRIRKYAYNIRTDDDSVERYSALKKLILLKKIGIYKEEHKLYLSLNDKHRKFAEDFFTVNNINKTGLKVFFAPNSRVKTRRWTQEGFAELGDLLAGKYSASVIFQWGNPEELQYTKEIIGMMKTKPVLMPLGRLKEMAAVIEKCDLMVTCDFGPKHIGTAIGIPTITIFGSTKDIVWNPPERDKFIVVKSDIHCINCGKDECDHITCMKKVTAEDIEEAMLKLKKNGYLSL